MSSPVEPGDLIADKYRVERVIGRGGMGVVVAAVHEKLGQRVAVKFLLPAALGSPQTVTRFEREARAAVALHSEHVSRVLDVGRLADGAPYMVMEMLDGQDLLHELQRRGPLPPHEAAAHIIQACDALAEAHHLGIVHRDIKPSNLFLTRRPKRASIIKVLDFGISKSSTFTENVSELTHTKDLIGSPLYMSPEQLCTPKTIDGRSDIWALGATLYELACGLPPFDGGTLAELSANILTTSAPNVRTRKGGEEVPEGLAEVLARCLEKDPAKRFATAEDLASALAPFAKAPEDVSTQMESPDIVPTATSPAARTLPLLPAPSAVTPVAPKNESSAGQAASHAAVSYQPPPMKSPSRQIVLFGVGLAVIGVAIFAFRSFGSPRDPALQLTPAASIVQTPSSVETSVRVPSPPSDTRAPPIPETASAPSASANAPPPVTRPAQAPLSASIPKPVPPASVVPALSAPTKPSASPLDMKIQ